MVTVQVTAFIAGSVFLLIAIIGGGFAIRGLGFLIVTKVGRIFLGVVGVLFIGYSVLVTLVVPGVPGEPSARGDTIIYASKRFDISPHNIRVSGLRAVSQNDPLQVNDRITISFSFQNDGQQPVTLGYTFIGARGPANEHRDFAEANYNKVLTLDGAIAIESSIVVTEKGVWKFWPCYTIGDEFCPDEWEAFEVVVVERQ